MGEWHPERKALENFLGGRLAKPDSRALECHLFTCAPCEERLLSLLPAAPEEQGGGYGALIRNFLEEARPEMGDRKALLARERQEAQALWQTLLKLSPAERLGRLVDEARFHTWGLFELLIEESRHPAEVEPRAPRGSSAWP